MTPEPRIALPLSPLLVASAAGILPVCGLLALLGVMLGRAGPFLSASLGTALVALGAALLATFASVPWIAKPASTAMLAWTAGSMLRLLLTAAGAFLLYSAPPSGWLHGVGEARAPFLLAVATAYLAGLLAEVGVVARILRQT
ncbi:MAG TPA: hypothetical protein PKC43_11010 [Phycisphaerales bacterium]|nr:hypothetical protein [Phycisphaerales bacterium]HMP37963.1 hypothetical protein [Phycisphaerales bacterium]